MNLNGYLWNAQDARVGRQMGKEEEEKKSTEALEDGKETFVCETKEAKKKRKQTGNC